MSPKALARVEQEITIKPGNPLAHFTLGYISYRTGRLGQSTDHLNEAITLNPRFAEARNLLGVVYLALDKEKEAIIELESAIEIDPRYETARYNLALTCLASGRRQEAYRQQRTLELLDSNLADPLLNLLSSDRIVNVQGLIIKR